MGYSDTEVPPLPLGTVSSEGGPLLLVDAASAGAWSGIDGADYDRASTLLDEPDHADGGEIAVGQAMGVLWEQGGAGTAYVFRVRDRIALVRWWGPNPDAEPSGELLDLPAKEQHRLGELRLSTPRLLILWATENAGEVLGLPAPPAGPAVGDLSVAGAGFVADFGPGRFDVVHESFDGPDGPGRRCWLTRRSD